ncbi:hypothetical protein C8R45DRAFT_929338 [Mycena sanguinolenta]|nr:hypothetical protein C8R45DRAFT_929338 [Mycena sanguinolenta]
MRDRVTPSHCGKAKVLAKFDSFKFKCFSIHVAPHATCAADQNLCKLPKSSSLSTSTLWPSKNNGWDFGDGTMFIIVAIKDRKPIWWTSTAMRMHWPKQLVYLSTCSCTFVGFEEEQMHMQVMAELDTADNNPDDGEVEIDDSEVYGECLQQFLWGGHTGRKSTYDPTKIWMNFAIP